MPWWGWVIVALLGLVWLMFFVNISWRRGIRREFVEFLKQRFPGLKVLEEHVLYLHVEAPGLDFGMMNLRGLYDAVSQVEVRTPQDRREVYRKYFAVLQEGFSLASRKLDRDRDAARIMPRLVTREFFAEDPRLAGAPNVPVGETGLFVVYVLDGDQSVVYLTREHLSELGMDESELGAVALENLRRASPIDHLVRDALEKKAMVAVKQLDSYDAARLLLLPDLLKDGEALIAAVPDRDTLVFHSAPEGADPDEMGALLTPGSDKLLLRRLLRVTSRGIDLV